MEIPPWDASRVQAFSAQMFGNKHRLEVALAILDYADRAPHRVYKQSIAAALGVKDSEIERHIRVFRKLDLLEPHPDPPRPVRRTAGRPPTIFRPTTDEFWHCLEELGTRFRRKPPSLGGSRRKTHDT